MHHLRIRLFGGLEVFRGETPLPPFPTRRARSLLAYLVLHRDRAVPRDVLCGLLWGEQPEAEARKALRTALWRIRSVLEPVEGERGRFLRVEGTQVIFQGTGNAWVDVGEFERCLGGMPEASAGVIGDEEAEGLVKAVRLYKGDLLDGIYDEWCLQVRERFKLAYLTALERLLAYHQARGSWLAAISFGRQLLRKDPIREHVHRQLMVCHLSMGDRPSALRQFETCERLMRGELGIEPMEETRRLHSWIRDRGCLPPDLEAGGAVVQPLHENRLKEEVDGALRDLQRLLARLEAAREGRSA
jgi:DNA-binding SARP family transcriptional activator